ncbi:GldG family protein [Ruminococcus sp. 210702-SL.1.03]|uniref:GldG family protein n=1 Tax=Ruminococcus sp. 210702-SL.1.03 TaxID=2883233 RepID=UPI001D092876|nr:GldG family protein [Ruminococcus sp. 210702-SL.1.03]MCB6615214.1 GldG family protein [Ruminococcus sp. 210702-SL.1.03]
MSNKNNENLEPQKEGAGEEYVTSTDSAKLLSDVLADEKKEAEDTPAAEQEAADKAEAEDTEEESGKSAKGKKKSKHEMKKLKHGMLSGVYIVVFIAVIVLVNVICGILFDKYPITFDLTKNSIYSISKESEEYVKSVDTEVTFKVFATEDSFSAINDYSKQADEVLQNYRKYNNKISVEYIDLDSNPDVVSDYSDQNLAAYDIIAESTSKDKNGNIIKDDNGDPLKRIRKISLLELVNFTDDFETQAQQTYGLSASDYLLQYFGTEATAFANVGSAGVVESSNADQAFVSALMAVTDPDPVTVTFLTGRNESDDLSYFQTLLEANGYTVNSVDIRTEDIPEDTDLCVLAAPQTDYLDTEIQKISDFLDNDGKLKKNMIYMASAQQASTPNLDEFLAEYYIEIGDGIIFDNDQQHTYQNSMTGEILSMADDINDGFTQDISSDTIQIASSYSRPIKILAEEKGKHSATAYVSSTDSASVMDTSTGKATENGKQIYAALASKAVFNDDGTTDYSNIFVCGSYTMFSDTYLMYEQFQNREYLLSVVNGMTGKTTSGITIEPKVITGNIFDVDAAAVKRLKIIFIGVIPVATLVIGLTIWLRRKNR